MTTWMVVMTLWAALLPGIALATGVLRPSRDIFFLLVYLQSFIYLDLAPTFAAPDVDAAMQSRYVWVQVWSFLLFQVPMLVLYVILLARRTKRYRVEERAFHISKSRLWLFTIGCTLFGIAYFVIASRYGIVYRRVGGQLAGVQLSMNLVEFALYRSFIELGPFLIAAFMMILRAPSDITPGMRVMTRVGLVLTTTLFLGYAVLNTRLYAIITLVTLYGISTMMKVGGRSFRPARVLVLGGVLFTAFYMVKVVENVRVSYARGEDLLAIENFLPMSAHEEKDDALKWRLNGIDLIAIIADNVESQGAAKGSAWALPFVLSLDPIVRTAFTIDAKRANLTSAKTILLLRYAGVAKADYYSCILSDAYGNFSIYGFLLVAWVLAVILARSVAALRYSASVVGPLMGAFAITRILPFEQEFGSLLYGWYKLLPFLAVIVVFFPLRPIKRRTIRSTAPAGQRLGPTVATA